MNQTITFANPLVIRMPLEERIMATVAEIKQTLDTALAHVQAVDTKMDAVVALVQDLKAHVAAGGVATAAELDQIMTAAQAVQTPAAEAQAKEEALLQAEAPPA